MKKGLNATHFNAKSGNVGCDVLRAREKVDTCELVMRGSIKSGDRTKPVEICGNTKVKGDLCVDGCITQAGCDTYDYVIVGGGTAGCALARKLSDNFDNSVLIIEAGANVSDDPGVLGSNILATFGLANPPQYSKIYQADYAPGTFINYSDGRGLGGSSLHNGLQAVRGTPTLWNKWASITGEASWNYNNLLVNVMKPMEKYTPNGTVANSAQRGTTGVLNITQQPPISADPFMIAVGTATGSPQVSDFNDPTLGEIGIGSNQQWTTPPIFDASSVRVFSANAYLTGVPASVSQVAVPAVIYPNGTSINPARKLTAVMGAHGDKVIFDAFKNAIGVVFVDTKTEQVVTVNVNKQVILCAGTIESAAILQRSGVGDSTLLASLGIPEVFANSNVGANLQNHTGAVAVVSPGTFALPLPNYGLSFIDLSGYGYSAGTRRTQLIVAPFPFTPAGVTNALGIPPNGVSIIGISITPNEGPDAATSYGSVTIISKDPFIEPKVDLNPFSDGTTAQLNSDANKCVAFYKTVQDIVAESGDTVLFPSASDYAGGDAALLAAATTFAPTIAYHNSGSCRMAMTAATGVCDGKLRVFGVNKLMLADNAVAPLVEDGNTAYQAFVIGHQAARFIAANFT
jgi:choline dehydrogenase-like flavoprotein